MEDSGGRRRREAPGDLVERARHDRHAFAEIYDLYLSRIFAYCRLHCGSREEAEDLTALTFERALKALPQYQDRGLPFSAWLLRIASNAVADHHRRRARIPAIADLTAPGEDDRAIHTWEHALWLRSHLDALPHDQQTVLRLRFYDDCTFQEVARRMGRSEGAVKQLVRRALAALNTRIQEEAAYDVGV